MIEVSFSERIKDNCPNLAVCQIECSVVNTESDIELWKEISEYSLELAKTVKTEEINKWRPIEATRKAYKLFGKDPNRYRPSAEALRRRIVKGLELYKVNTLVDLINLVSLKSGYSIGGFDAEKVSGALCLGVGEENEVYHGIGRGVLNIQGLPVYRDSIGGIGTPTSDEERTKISLQTTRLLILINGYSGEEGLLEAMNLSVDLLKKYVSAAELNAAIITNNTERKVMI